KVDLRNMKSNMNLNKKESDEDESDEDDNISEDNSEISHYSEDSVDNMEDNMKDDEINKIEFERFNDTSHIYWPEDFHKNISDLHLLRILLGYNKISAIQPLCSPQRDESIELMLKTRIKETEIIRGIP
ncbi:7371_t:CDS:2, partial [Rhizophagus irregularis]